MNLLFISLSPILIIAIYIYIRDKYEHEPISLLILALIIGAFISMPVVFVERILSSIQPYFKTDIEDAAYTAFIVASFTEETFKLIGLFVLIWWNKNFNEKFDGIVYAVYISLGFAAVENVMYVTNYGYDVGITRALTAVPAHAIFGISMGYYFGLAKFYTNKRTKYLLLSFILPFVLHGIYDFILMAGFDYMMFIFIPFIVFMWIYGLKHIKKLSEQSVYRNDGIGDQDSNIFGF